MQKRKATILSCVISLIAFATIVISAKAVGYPRVFAFAQNMNSTWRHYSEVPATKTTNGCKEYWTNCDGTTQLFEPEGEPVVDYGAPNNDFINSLAPNDIRYIPSMVERYSYGPVVEENIPKMVVALTEYNGAIPLLENTKLVTGKKWDKGGYYPCSITMSNYGGKNLGISGKQCQIKVRGNYTANYDKKPFRLKFDKKIQMPGFDGKYKNWVLLADVKDHSMLRNSVSFYLGNKILGSDGYYCTNYRPIELYFIDAEGVEKYWGSYLLCEQQEVKAGKINVTDVEDLAGDDGIPGSYSGTDIGYFLEYDGYYTGERGGASGGFFVGYDTGELGDPTFTISYNDCSPIRTINGNFVTPNQPGFTVKNSLSSEDNSNHLAFISNYIDLVYKIIFEATYNNSAYAFNETRDSIHLDSELSPQEAICKVVDIQSLVDMFILSEIVCDPDVAWSSFTMDVDFGFNAKNNLLRFEAPWDFDSCYALIKGNYCNSGEGYYAAEKANPWLTAIACNEWFLNLVMNKYNELFEMDVLKDVLDYINVTSTMDCYQQMYNNNIDKWGSFDSTNEVRPEIAALSTQREHAIALYDWLYHRLNWLNTLWGNGLDVISKAPAI